MSGYSVNAGGHTLGRVLPRVGQLLHHMQTWSAHLRRPRSARYQWIWGEVVVSSEAAPRVWAGKALW